MSGSSTIHFPPLTMSADYEKLFWNTKKDGDARGALTPWLYEDHETKFTELLLKAEGGSPELAQEIKEAYMRNEQLYYEQRREIDEECLKKQLEQNKVREAKKNKVVKQLVEEVEARKKDIAALEAKVKLQAKDEVIEELKEEVEEIEEDERRKELKKMNKAEQLELIAEYEIVTDAKKEDERIDAIVDYELTL